MTAVLGGVLAVVGCSDHGDDSTRGPSATVRAEPATTTTTLVPVDQVPAVIDVAYVQRVIDVLDHVMGDAVRALVAAKAPDRAFYERHRAVYLDPQFDTVQADFGRLAADELRALRENPGDPVTKIDRLITATSPCIFAKVIRTFGPSLNVEPARKDTETWLALGRKRPDFDPSKRNPTAWAIGFDGSNVSGREPKDPCV